MGTRLKWGGSHINAEATVTLNAEACVDMFGIDSHNIETFAASMRPIEAERMARALMKAATAARTKVKP